MHIELIRLRQKVQFHFNCTAESAAKWCAQNVNASQRTWFRWEEKENIKKISYDTIKAVVDDLVAGRYKGKVPAPPTYQRF